MGGRPQLQGLEDPMAHTPSRGGLGFLLVENGREKESEGDTGHRWEGSLFTLLPDHVCTRSLNLKTGISKQVRVLQKWNVYSPQAPVYMRGIWQKVCFEEASGGITLE